MAWCENCSKVNLRKADVEFCNDHRKVLCHGCYSRAHPGWMPPEEYVDVSETISEVLPRIDYSISLDNKNGFKAKVSYGELGFQFHAPMEQIKKYLGPV